MPSSDHPQAEALLALCVRRSEIGERSNPGTEVSVVVPSDVRYIEEAVALMARHCLSGPSSSSRLRFRLQVTLSEALANAIINGNGEDPQKSVTIRAECRSDAIEIAVTDQGEGFDPARSQPGGPEDVDRLRGRGLFLIRHLSDGVRFNTQGNSICIRLLRR